MLFFGKKRKKEQEIDEAFAKVYQEIETIDNWNDPKKLEHYILDSCEQIIALTKEIEEEKAEYRVVTSYLTDIQTIEGLPDETRQAIREAASNIEQLNAARQAYENASYNISDSQFLLMEQNEDDVPQTIHRMLENERYQGQKYPRGTEEPVGDRARGHYPGTQDHQAGISLSIFALRNAFDPLICHTICDKDGYDGCLFGTFYRGCSGRLYHLFPQPLSAKTDAAGDPQ